jgi:hypothetical protein
VWVPGSTLPGDLRAMGYDVTEIGEGERILPAAIIERFGMRAGCAAHQVRVGSQSQGGETAGHRHPTNAARPSRRAVLVT